ncbi:S-adenosyl-L-methionine-dependent methyltransferase [Aureobasidium pullulans]|nr:S-adenosyl-L-methionine-dependent methyltransferase [Aureobasidium pullulans]
MASETSPGTAASTTSDTLATYVTDYRMENGRRYHAYADGEYWGPNDEQSTEAECLSHAMYLETLGGELHLAPVKNPREILDVGTGTGIWAIQMADKFPEAQVTGTDLSPIQPDLVPCNCVFEIDDASLEWTWEDNHLDYVHVREMFGSIRDWDLFFSEALRCIVPGGYVEIMEHSTWPVSDDDTLGPDHFFNTWGRTIEELGGKWGKSFNTWKESKALLEKAGFVDVVEKRFKWPMNGWSQDPALKHLGELNRVRLVEHIQGFTMRLLTTAGKWPLPRAHIFLAEMRNALKDLGCHAYQDRRYTEPTGQLNTPVWQLSCVQQNPQGPTTIVTVQRDTLEQSSDRKSTGTEVSDADLASN